MALHKDFPTNPYEILKPEIRWFPADESLREKDYERLLPPLVPKIRKLVYEWRNKNYEGASDTSKALLNWWFKEEHFTVDANGYQNKFEYYYCQREAVETIVYLYDVAKAKDKYDLIRYDTSGQIKTGLIVEDWLRMVIKMATGSGKTKVISLILTWCYFHKLYEPNSELAKNFLLITPNIIVLDRIKTDFAGLKIFSQDPILPENGYEGRDWKTDFQIKIHMQDEIGTISDRGNIFLTNIHRVFEGNVKIPSPKDQNTMEYFLGEKPVAKTNDSKIDLGQIIREVDELIVINDEAHHIHDEKMAWFKSIEDISNRLKQKGKKLSLQIDVTATPKHNNGAIFVQTVSDYPLVEAIHQRIVKKPVIPDEASKAKLVEKKSSRFIEKYEDFINLGVIEWRKTYKEWIKVNKKSILFIMTDDTKNCDDVADYLSKTYPEFKDSVLTIHTNKSGEISENVTGKSKVELEKLRKQSNEIDKLDSPYKAIVSVLMLKEGWDVKNVTTVVGLRAYSSKSNILPEQTLGRGLRLMFRGGGIQEYVSIIGTPAFMDFVESIKSEGVEFEQRKMDINNRAIAPLVVEIDQDDKKKDIENLDIEIPVLTARIQREYKNLNKLDVSNFNYKKLDIKNYSKEEQRKIVFKDVVKGEIHHETILESNIAPNYQNLIGFYAQEIMRELHLFGCYDILYGKVKEFIAKYLFKKEVNLEDLNILCNLHEIEATRTITETFKKYINELTVVDKGDTEIKNYIKLKNVRPFTVNDQQYLVPKKSIFNRIVGDSNFELQFADFLERCDDIISFAKNYFAVQFKLDYQDADGKISYYYPDFLVKKDNKNVYIVETKGQEDLDDALKIKRLKQWCEDVNNSQNKHKFHALYIRQEEFEKDRLGSFEELIRFSE